MDSFAEEWGRENGIKVTVDHVNVGDLKPLVDAETAKGEGHDLFELVSPPANLENHVMDLTDVNLEAQSRFGEQISLCTNSSYNATTGKFYGFCHGWVPDPGDYRRSLWEKVDRPQGPDSWDELLESGSRIKSELTIQMGTGMAHELDSNMAGRSLIWAFGGSIQDENENVVINSPETVEAVKYMVKLYRDAMTDEVFEWNAASNNKALIAARASSILNSVSAYRTAQKTAGEVSDDVFFVPPLLGPNGERKASAHIFNVYVIPKYSPIGDIAKAFMLALTENYDQAVYNSELYNFPAFFSTSPELMAPGGWLDIDPFESNPLDKLPFFEGCPRLVNQCRVSRPSQRGDR